MLFLRAIILYYTTIFVFGVPVFKREIIDTTDSRHRPVGFNVYASDVPGYIDDEDYDEQ